jgi:hypothetical protein
MDSHAIDPPDHSRDTYHIAYPLSLEQVLGCFPLSEPHYLLETSILQGSLEVKLMDSRSRKPLCYQCYGTKSVFVHEKRACILCDGVGRVIYSICQMCHGTGSSMQLIPALCDACCKPQAENTPKSEDFTVSDCD